MSRRTQGDGVFLYDEATVLGAAIKERSSISVGLCSIRYELAAVPFITMTYEMFQSLSYKTKIKKLIIIII